MLKRDIWNELIAWKESNHHPLVIKGLRQIGKTYIVKKFGEEHYDSCIYLDLRSDITIHSAFDGDFNVDQMVMSISAVKRDAKFINGVNFQVKCKHIVAVTLENKKFALSLKNPTINKSQI